MESRTLPRLDLDAIRRDNPLPDVAGAVVELKPAGREWKARCPFHSERTPSFTIFSGGQRFHCFGCGASGDVLDFVQALHGVGLRDAAAMLGADTLPRVSLPSAPPAPDKSKIIAEAREIWEASEPARRTLAETYLRSRAITCAIPDSIRYRALPYRAGGREHPCLIAAITGIDGRLGGIQRTFLAPDGAGKADVPKPKLCLGQVSGGAIRLGTVARNLIVCAGVEDGLSLQQELCQPVWAVPGDTNLLRLVLPPTVRTVAIGGDNDRSGRDNTLKAAEAFSATGIAARRFFPVSAHDFNEELQEVSR
ncbi:CHC2 zinc finger domain-containing protein [uncultured Erythrobacter sp.]|nr:CHC2 zinc finger domain-containing protein [uncultured Erythrobacter sp.]